MTVIPNTQIPFGLVTPTVAPPSVGLPLNPPKQDKNTGVVPPWLVK